MFKPFAFALTFAISLAACSSQGDARQPTRLDATTVKSAERSFQRMADELPQDKKQQLVMAMLAINLSGAGSASDVARTPAFQSPSIGRIRKQVAGMTADEIISYAASVSTVKMEVQVR